MKNVYAYLLEDSPVIRQSLISTLEELTSVKVVGATDSEALAVQALSVPGQRIDLVIVDVVLREGTGLGVLRRADVKRRDRQFVVLTNYATLEVREHVKALGAVRVFDKSSQIDALIDFCRALSNEVGSEVGSGERNVG